MQHGKSAAMLLVFIVAAGALAAARVLGDNTFLAQPGARSYLLRLFAILIPYAATTIWIGAASWALRASVLPTSLAFGAATGTIAVSAIAIENASLVAMAARLAPIAASLVMFALWGLAGFQVTRRSRSMKEGWIASVGSAMVCMIIAVTGGLLIELFLAHTNPGEVATWQEFKRSGWTDPAAFQVANSLDSAFSHLLLAPAVATIFGVIGSVLGLLVPAAPSRSAREV